MPCKTGMTEPALPTTWILLRGLTRSAAHWGSFTQSFADAFAQAQVVTLDLPGNGTLYAQRSPTHIAELVDFCRSELQRRGHHPPYAVLAMSMGAMVTVHWAQTTPHELMAAVLINTSVRPLNPMFHRLRPANYARILGMLLRRPDVATLEQHILYMTSNHPDRHAGTHAQWVAERLQHPVSTPNTLRQLLAAARFKAAAAAPTCPVLLLGSAHDNLVDIRCTQTIARQWNCASAVHPSAGHDLPLDDPQWVVEHVRRWHSAHKP